MMEDRLKHVIEDYPDYPKPGIVFKDISPILSDPLLFGEVVQAFVNQIRPLNIDVMVGIESRGFWFGPTVANQLNIPFVPIRKKGKLPGDTHVSSYELEYGSAEIEIQKGRLLAGSRVLIHDDLLATGGTVLAAKELVEKTESEVVAYAFLVHLTFLNAETLLKNESNTIISLVNYD